MTLQRDAEGRATRTTYDALHHPRTQRLPGDAERTITTVYNIHGDLESQTDPREHATTHTYDTLGRRVLTTHPDVDGTIATQRVTYDKVGNVLTETNGRNQPTTYTVNALNQRVKPEAAENVSFRHRFDAIKRASTSDRPLLPIAGNGPACNVSEVEYLQLVDETGRMIRNDKPGSIDRSLPTIVRRRGLSERAWFAQVQGTQSRYWRVIGNVESFLDKAAELQQRWLHGLAFARRLSATLNST